jgi:hypothetical protein
MKSKILAAYPHFQITEYSNDLFIADYTLQTANQREVEILVVKPTDINSFEIKNPTAIETSVVVFNKLSFVDQDGNPLSQCECIAFPNVTFDKKPWILFLELKYCLFKNAIKKLNDAKNQLFDTLGYFRATGIIENGQLCYLVASLPKQNNTPFENFIMTPKEVARLKKEDNIIFRGANQITIKSESQILV